jgi:hypothetical protein
MPDTENIRTLNELAKKLDRATEKYLLGEKVFCSFCSKEQAQVKTMLSGTAEGVYICNECITSCQQTLHNEEPA